MFSRFSSTNRLRPPGRTFALALWALGAASACSQGASQNEASGEESATTAAQGNAALATGVATAATSPNSTIVQKVASPRYLGRFNTVDPNGPRMSWPGSQILAGFTGTSISARFADVTTWHYGADQLITSNYLDVSIDNGAPTVIQLSHTPTTYPLAKSLAAGNHTIRISKRTESDMGTAQFLGFTLDSGSTLIPVAGPSDRRIEFVGDSGTLGYGADGNVTLENMCGFTPKTEHADVSYAMQTGVILHADIHNSSYSGKGLYQNRDVAGDSYYTLPVLWTLTLADTYITNVPWATSDWIPQAVVAVVSGNDFYASTPPAAQFQASVTGFFAKIRSAYPDAHIFLMVSPMLRSAGSDNTPGGGPRATGLAYAQQAVQAYSGTDKKVHFLPTDEDFGPLYGCDQHLTVASHRKYAEVIAQAIGAQLGWTSDLTATTPTL